MTDLALAQHVPKVVASELERKKERGRAGEGSYLWGAWEVKDAYLICAALPKLEAGERFTEELNTFTR